MHMEVVPTLKRRRRSFAAVAGPAPRRAYRGGRQAIVVPQSRLRRGRRANIRTGGFLGIEYKFYDTSLTGAALTSPADATGGEHNPSATISLNTVVQGDGESNRDGRQIVMKALHVTGNVNIPVQVSITAGRVSPIVYIAVVWDKQANGAILASENVFTNPGAVTGLAATPLRNLQYIKRFKVLKSRTIQMPTDMPITYDGVNIEQAGCEVHWRMDIKLPNIEVNYSATTETIANTIDNSLSIVAFCSTVSQAPVLNYNARLRFVG